MPRANWGISKGTVENFDRERQNQFKPYDGPIPLNAVYRWRVNRLQFVAGTREKNPQLRIGLTLVPRSRDEKRYEGYRLMLYPPIADNTAFRYVPFLDALGVSEREFREGTITDEEGNIKKMGRWRNTGDATIKGELVDETDQNGQLRKTIKWMGADTGEVFEDDSEDDYDGDDEYAEDEDGEWDDDE